MKLAIIGSTGEIGKRTLKVTKNNRDCRVTALLCKRNWRLIGQQIQKYKPKLAVVLDQDAMKKTKKTFALNGTRLTSCPDELLEHIEKYHVDTVVSATIGSSLLKVNYKVLDNKIRLLLANKESIVLAGNLLKNKAKRSGSEIIPLDSEHFGLFSIIKQFGSDFDKLYLTASGGPFRNHTKKQLQKVSIKDALKHPIWKMGKRITIDSATMMNKAFELIEACNLFNVSHKKIYVLIHPQSIIHAMVEYRNGTTYAQMSIPKMEIPIQSALFTGNSQGESNAYKLNIEKMRRLELEPVGAKNEAINLARFCSEKGKSYPIALNAADEVAVDLFLNNKIKFTNITELAKKVIKNHRVMDIKNISDILEADRIAREETYTLANSSIIKC